MQKRLPTLLPLLLAVGAGVFLFAESARKPVAAMVWTHEASDIAVDPEVKFGALPNGLRYAIRKNAEPPGRVSLRLHIDAGSLHEAEDQRGLAHFLEHMVFNGSKNFPDVENLLGRMQRLGIAFGAHANAYTSFDE
ncbi:MAG: insulinase family protein, partial [Akkermansiaceae bacterium]|nr:insulinase family protein [Akkermansiaceae bacterium]